MAISMLKIRRPLGRLIFNMGIAIPGKTVFLIEKAPSPLPKPSQVAQADVGLNVIQSDTCLVWTFYLCLFSLMFLLEAPGEKKLMRDFYFVGARLLPENWQNLSSLKFNATYRDITVNR